MTIVTNKLPRRPVAKNAIAKNAVTAKAKTAKAVPVAKRAAKAVPVAKVVTPRANQKAPVAAKPKATPVDMARVQEYVAHITGRKSFNLIRCRAADSKYMVRAEPTVAMGQVSVNKMIEEMSAQLKRKPKFEEAKYGCAYVFNLGRKREVRLSINEDGRTQRVRGVTVREYL